MMNLALVHRITKIILSISISLFFLFVGIDNLLNFNANYQFVQHVLAMNSMQLWFDASTLEYRTVTNPTIQLISYTIIIFAELLAGIFGLIGSIIMVKNINKADFSQGQACFLFGGSVAIALWYLGFAVIDGEWFSMWANQWNGQMKAYTFATSILVSMIYVLIPTPEEK
ncbi:DUF2165 family protein [Moritella viscosa]|uniref:DUF2165 domain-containing protein n=1 Tax=Moritella viscosa TaxID=80854 RepID=A0A090IAG0_9GAMM|nr:DUF2165 domain-containing protein [Moritella viscosa]CED58925.1 membrane protein [Moritella viscosa]SGY84365.1 Putative uncharacterized protein [Moritella viscosa]SGY85255.1 Putative uncharacterized protein [Moritella viscosa]SGY86399.1 Putative uncharacterized protein [Moritella viscosa]SGY86436.1 Putative uncharacterized protein [Moritella viscosa]